MFIDTCDPELDLYKIIKMTLEKFRKHECGRDKISVNDRLELLRKILPVANIEELSFDEVIRCSDETGFFFHEFMYRLIEPILPDDWKKKVKVTFDECLIAVWDALDSHNEMWWIENEVSIMEMIKNCQVEKLRDMFDGGSSPQDAHGTFSMILAI